MAQKTKCSIIMDTLLQAHTHTHTQNVLPTIYLNYKDGK
jgi:hypothetical protein